MGAGEITAKFNPGELTSLLDENAKPSGTSARLLIGAKTDLGRVRENNEDKFEFYLPADPAVLSAKGCLLAVSDGMGGHAAGQIASELGLKTLVSSYFSDTHADVPGCLKAAMILANSVVHGAAGLGGRQGMGATLTVAIVRGEELTVGNIGDSRAYLMHDGKLTQVTEDHSWVAEQVKAGVLTEDEAQMSPFRNVITRSLGTHPEVEPDITTHSLSVGAQILLCTDGLSGVVTNDQMQSCVASHGPAESCHELVEMALDAGGPDNVTVLVARVQAMEPIGSETEPTASPRKGGLRLFG